MNRTCPSCGTEVPGFRGVSLRKGPSPYPSQKAERKAKDVKACPNPECEGRASDYKKHDRDNLLGWIANRLYGREK